jgi:hypothetical protein
MIQCRYDTRHEALDDNQIAMKIKLDYQYLKSQITAHLIDTPKHLIAIATSNQTDALGKVICEMAKNDDRLYGALAAQRDRKYSPREPAHAENIHVSTPGISPPDAMAY